MRVWGKSVNEVIDIYLELEYAVLCVAMLYSVAFNAECYAAHFTIINLLADVMLKCIICS